MTYSARRVADAPVDATSYADSASAAAFRSGPRRAVAPLPATIVSRLAPATLSVALVATTAGILVGSRAEADPVGAQTAPDTTAVRANALSRGGARAVQEAGPAPAETATAPVAAAWSAQFSAVVATWYAQADVPVLAKPSQDAAVIATLKGGDRVEVTERVIGDYREVVHNRTIGWVPAAQVGAKAPVPGGVQLAPGKTSSTRVLGLTAQAMGVYNAVMSRWGGEINTVGGYRSSSRSDHQYGRAIDFMLTPGKESALGWTVAKYLAANAGELGVDHIIFEQKIWTPNNPTWRPMADRGSITQNHYDHVHVSVER